VDIYRSSLSRLGEALAGLVERPARLSFSSQAAMEIEGLLHAAFLMAKAALVFAPPPPKNENQALKNPLRRK